MGSASLYADAISEDMSEFPTRLRDHVSRAFDHIDHALTLERTAAAGPFQMRLLFESRTLADAYLRSLLPSRTDDTDFSIAVLGANDIDLSELIPSPPERGRALAGAGYSAIWYADRLPILYVFDRESRRGVIWLAKSAAPAWELSRPAGPLVQAAMFDRPWTLIHAAAVGCLGRMVLLAGKGHSGKTTAALACTRVGWDYAGDDYILANCATGELAPLYSSARLRIDMGHAFTEMLPAVPSVSLEDGDGRHELNLSDVVGLTRIKGGKLAAILLPRRRGAAVPQFARARPSDAFHALFLSTSMGAPGPMKLVVAKLSALVALAPAFFVDTGRYPEEIPAAFAAFMDGL